MERKVNSWFCLSAFLWVVFTAPSLLGEEQSAGGDGSKSLAQGVQNPVSNLIQLPFQYNAYYETGPKARTSEVLLI